MVVEGEISQLEILLSKGKASYVVFAVWVFVYMITYTWDFLCQLAFFIKNLRLRLNVA